MTESKPRTCNSCQKKVIPIYEIMPKGFRHYAKISCPECGHFRWDKKPENKTRRTKTSDYTLIELGKDTCDICGRPQWKLGYEECLELHHKVPVSEGGPDKPENIWALCTFCHRLVKLVRDSLHHHLDNFYSFKRP